MVAPTRLTAQYPGMSNYQVTTMLGALAKTTYYVDPIQVFTQARKRTEKTLLRLDIPAKAGQVPCSPRSGVVGCWIFEQRADQRHLTYLVLPFL